MRAAIYIVSLFGPVACTWYTGISDDQRQQYARQRAALMQNGLTLYNNEPSVPSAGLNTGGLRAPNTWQPLTSATSIPMTTTWAPSISTESSLGSAFNDLLQSWKSFQNLEFGQEQSVVRPRSLAGGNSNTWSPTTDPVFKPFQPPDYLLQGSQPLLPAFPTPTSNSYQRPIVQSSTIETSSNGTSSNRPQRVQKPFTCAKECRLQSDCSNVESCFGASAQVKGCCLQALLPNQTGCVIDEQCSRSCESSYCDTEQTPSRCLCDEDRHYLFKKCWKQCPDFSEPVNDIVNGLKECRLTVSNDQALALMRRHKRQFESGRIFC